MDIESKNHQQLSSPLFNHIIVRVRKTFLFSSRMNEKNSRNPRSACYFPYASLSNFQYTKYTIILLPVIYPPGHVDPSLQHTAQTSLPASLSVAEPIDICYCSAASRTTFPHGDLILRGILWISASKFREAAVRADVCHRREPHCGIGNGTLVNLVR